MTMQQQSFNVQLNFSIFNLSSFFNFSLYIFPTSITFVNFFVCLFHFYSPISPSPFLMLPPLSCSSLLTSPSLDDHYHHYDNMVPSHLSYSYICLLILSLTPAHPRSPSHIKWGRLHVSTFNLHLLNGFT